jgi:hypothetical protein
MFYFIIKILDLKKKGDIGYHGTNRGISQEKVNFSGQ